MDSTTAPGSTEPTEPTEPTDSPGSSVRLEAALRAMTDRARRSEAELINYRRRVEEARKSDQDNARVALLADLVPLLDDIDRAEAHGELTGGVGAVGRRFRDQLRSLGLERYGAAGDPFDPHIHNAVAHLTVASVTEPSCLDVVSPGYSYRGISVRVAQVAVATPSDRTTPSPTAATDPRVTGVPGESPAERNPFSGAGAAASS